MTGTEQQAHCGNTAPVTFVTTTSESHEEVALHHPPSTSSRHPHAAGAFVVTPADGIVVAFAAARRFATGALSPVWKLYDFLALISGNLLRAAGRFVHDFPGLVYAMTVGSVFFLVVLILETTEK